jgi:hypothetical protein
MNDATIQFLFKSFIVVSVLLILASIYMAIKGVDGWGWFLFAGVVVLGGITYNEGNKEEKEEEDD